METIGNTKENLTIKQLLKSHERLLEVLKICKTNSNYDWNSNLENPPQNEFKFISNLIEEVI
jgi:hypothetical protein